MYNMAWLPIQPRRVPKSGHSIPAESALGEFAGAGSVTRARTVPPPMVRGAGTPRWLPTKTENTRHSSTLRCMMIRCWSGAGAHNWRDSRASGALPSPTASNANIHLSPRTMAFSTAPTSARCSTRRCDRCSQERREASREQPRLGLGRRTIFREAPPRNQTVARLRKTNTTT
jgi:hypothetical protein